MLNATEHLSYANSSFPLSTIINICAALRFNLSKNHLNHTLDIVQSSNLPVHCIFQSSHVSLKLLLRAITRTPSLVVSEQAYRNANFEGLNPALGQAPDPPSSLH